MIGWLRGRVIAEEPDGKLLVDVNGVGYEVAVPAGTLGRGSEHDGVRDFFVHTHVREDALELFGFVNDRDRSAFRLLIAIPNVGPKTALGVLSSLSVSELARAVAAGDAARLSKVPGIGKRTSERLLLELKGKLDDLEEGTIPSTKPAGMRTRLVSALTNMGYRPSEAEKAVSSLGQRVDSEPLGDLIKLALAELR
jgi:Holliday junction DNA helicase RuvA